eukprot:901467-Rhodomonas_salina.1
MCIRDRCVLQENEKRAQRLASFSLSVCVHSYLFLCAGAIRLGVRSPLPCRQAKRADTLFLPAQVTTALLWTRHWRSSTRADSAPQT